MTFVDFIISYLYNKLRGKKRVIGGQMEILHVGEILEQFFSGIVILSREEEIMFISDSVHEHFNKTLFLKTYHKHLNSKKSFYYLFNKKHFEVTVKSLKEFSVFIFNNTEDLTNAQNKIYCYEKIISQIHDGIILSDVDGRILLYNEAQEKLEGLNKKNVENKLLWEAYNYESKEASEHQRVIKTGKPIKNKYKAHAHQDSVPQYTSYSTYPIKKNGQNIGVFSVSKNETVLKDLLYETIELKRQLFSHEATDHKGYNQNGTTYTFEEILGNSQSLRDVISEAKNIAMLSNNFLIYGETGTGKEVFAQSIHNLGENSQEPFVPINCAAIPEGLFEGILFGTVKGSYTGSQDQIGLFEEAGSGTLFLDELNSMPISMQTKLLRVLQEKRVRRVGGLKTKPIRCRIISAVNQDPERLMQKGLLREDLFYRIAGFTLNIPPIRQRREDILTMADYFIKRYNIKLNKRIKEFSTPLKELLLCYKWPGNVRELEHVVENLMIRTRLDEKILTINHLPGYLKNKLVKDQQSIHVSNGSHNLTETLKSIEKQMIMDTLKKNHGNVSQSARDLGIIRQSLIYRMKKLNIPKKDY